MRKFTAILVFLLMSYPVYGREGRDRNSNDFSISRSGFHLEECQ